MDIEPQPRFPFEFHQADALIYPLDGFDVIHASPPCQIFSVAQRLRNNKHPDLLTPIKNRLISTGIPYVIENVPGAPMRVDLVLCGSHFKLPRLRRHRWFEIGNLRLKFPPLPPCNHQGKAVLVFGHSSKRDGTMQERKAAMGINWMNQNELSEAIPPAYTHFIGKQLVEALKRESRCLSLRDPPTNRVLGRTTGGGA